MPHPLPIEPFEIIETTAHAVPCDGGGGPLGHPRVWLHLNADAHRVTCGYCSRTYVLKGHGESGHVSAQAAIRQASDVA